MAVAPLHQIVSIQSFVDNLVELFLQLEVAVEEVVVALQVAAEVVDPMLPLCPLVGRLSSLAFLTMTTP